MKTVRLQTAGAMADAPGRFGGGIRTLKHRHRLRCAYVPVLVLRNHLKFLVTSGKMHATKYMLLDTPFALKATRQRSLMVSAAHEFLVRIAFQPDKGVLSMSVLSHIEHLQAKHAELESTLAGEMARPLPNFYAIKDIKKQKLLLKEEIARLMQGMARQKNAS